VDLASRAPTTEGRGAKVSKGVAPVKVVALLTLEPAQTDPPRDIPPWGTFLQLRYC
jgi:hypothetical protein